MVRREVRPTDQAPEGAAHPDAKPVIQMTPRRRGKPPAHLMDVDLAGRKQMLKDAGFPAFRADQLSRHYLDHLLCQADQMSDLPAAMHEVVGEKLLPPLIREVTSQHGDGGWTLKQLWALYDGAEVESVLMRYPSRTTLCLSSQAGCGMGCPFCATGQMGLTRNLSTAEMIEQVRLAKIACRDGLLDGPGPRKFQPDVNPDDADLDPSEAQGTPHLTNIVFMGMGEPLANWRSVREALHRILDPSPEGFGMSARNVTVSTVGLVPGIDKLAAEGLPVTLAVSLHAPDDDLRDELIPINSRWKVGELLDAARRYFVATGRRVSIEYALIKDMNDQPWRAELLAKEINSRGRGWVHVNPIPLNPTPGTIWTASTSRAQHEFVETLRAAGITTTIRDTRGADIDGACGQLATKAEQIRARRAGTMTATDHMEVPR